MNLNRIITEEIDNYIFNNIINEKKSSDEDSEDIRHGAIKRSGGRRGDFDAKLDKDTNPNLTHGDAEQIANALNNDVVNVAAVARQLYPNLTPNGAQSKLRKKIKHIPPYTLKKKEAFKARRIIDKEMDA